MLLWKIVGHERHKHRHGWLTAPNQAQADVLALREGAEIIDGPVDWIKGNATQIYWLVPKKTPLVSDFSFCSAEKE